MDVTVGLVNSHYVEIRGGLKEGDPVIYAGYETLKEDDPVVPTQWGPSGPLTLPPAAGKAAPGTEGGEKMPGMQMPPSGGTTPRTPNTERQTPMPPTGTVYTCRMHPEVRSDHPGKCPKCGMDLVPMKKDDKDMGGMDHSKMPGMSGR